MREIIFYFGTEIIMVIVEGHNIRFRNSSFGAVECPIEGLKLNQAGAIKEFPDLKDNPDWRDEAIKRFKNHIYSLNTEEKIAEYLINELKKYGYIPKYIQRAGFRPEVIK